MNEVKKAIEEYQCPGCVCGSSPDDGCLKQDNNKERCSAHASGTSVSGIGRIFLGMPTGFNRHGNVEDCQINIFDSFEYGWGYNKFNVPIWKHLDNKGNTLVRGLKPRVNTPFLHVFIGNHIDKIDCIEITKKDLLEMD
jgi:hypothetical protein